MALANAHDFFIQWHLTERCNLRCTHCYQSGTAMSELSFREICEVIAEVDEMLASWTDQFGAAFSPSFNITGGEPFLRNDLFDILAELGSRKFAAYLLTNGTLIDADRAKRLRDVGVRGVQVSIEGPEAVHDAIRGSGSFRASVRGIRHLLDHGHTVTMNTTLSNVNAGSFQEIIRLATSLGVQRLGFSRLVPSGRGRDMLQHALGMDEVRRLYREIFAMRPEGLEIVTGDPVASQISCAPPGAETSPEVPAGGCAAGLSGLTFLSDGTITPCRRMPVPIGNIRTDSIREVWATSEILERLRDRSAYNGKCASCSRWSTCRGCRAIAYAWSLAGGGDDILAEDPQCFIRD